jgi:ubiquitin-protein ligase
VRFREALPPVIRLMRPGLRPKSGNVMSTGAHCTDLLQPSRWSGRMSVNLVLPWLIEHLTDPQSGHGPAVVEHATLAVYNEEQVGHSTTRLYVAVADV